MNKYLLLPLLLVVAPCFAAEAVLSDAAKALIAPVHGAYARLDSEAPPQTVSERLTHMGRIDQAGRSAYQQVERAVSALPEEQRALAYSAIWDEITARDLENQRQLLTMLPPNGWFLKSEYGERAAASAFLIVQHAVNDVELLHATLARMEPLVVVGEVNGEAYGMLYDRTAMMDGRYQRYGSQMICQGHAWVLYPMENSDGVDERRKAMGFALSFSENMQRFVNRPPCPGEWTGKLPE